MTMFTIIVLSSVAILSIIVICLSIWLHKQKKYEKQKRLQLATDSAKRNKIYWDELCASGEGYFDDEVKDSLNNYIVPDETTKRFVASINIGADTHTVWTTTTNDNKNLKKEIFDDSNDKLIIGKLRKNELPYIINETVYTFDEKNSKITKTNRTKVYIDSEKYLHENFGPKNITPEEPKIEQIAKNLVPKIETTCDIKYEYLLIFVRDNKIKLHWFNTEDAAKDQMRSMLNKIGNIKAQFGDYYQTNNRSYTLNHFSASYRANKTKCDWLIVKLP